MVGCQGATRTLTRSEHVLAWAPDMNIQGLLIVVTGLLGGVAHALESSFAILQAMMIQGVMLNMVLIAFNLIPIPPLDGSHVMKYLLPASWSFRYMQVSRYGIIVLILVLYMAPGILNSWMRPAMALGTMMLTAVDRFFLPSTGQWLRWAPPSPRTRTAPDPAAGPRSPSRCSS